MQTKNNFLALFFLISCVLSTTVMGQLSLPISNELTLISVPEFNKIDKTKSTVTYPELESLLLLQEDPFTNAPSVQQNHVFNHYGFFCRQEAKRDKKTNIPIRMRLGTLDAVNQKEYGN